jgi:chromosome partitioning protein
MSVIAVFNQKGGVGKTTTTLNIGAALASRGKPALLIDIDPQSHLTLAAGLRNVPPAASLAAFFKTEERLGTLIRSLPSGLRVIPASVDLSKIEALHGGDPAISRRLQQGIAAELQSSDHPILIDCCPMLGVLTLSALIAADHVLIPVSADFLSLEGAGKLQLALGVLQQRLKKEFVIRVVVTRFDGRRRLSYNIYKELKERFDGGLCQTVITENVSLAESPMHAKDIFSYAPGSQGAVDYKALTEELEAGKFFD